MDSKKLQAHESLMKIFKLLSHPSSSYYYILIMKQITSVFVSRWPVILEMKGKLSCLVDQVRIGFPANRASLIEPGWIVRVCRWGWN